MLTWFKELDDTYLASDEETKTQSQRNLSSLRWKCTVPLKTHMRQYMDLLRIHEFHYDYKQQQKEVWDQYYISLADTNPKTPADGMIYFRQELAGIKKEIKAMSNAPKELKKRHIVEWQSQLMDVELHLRRLGQLPTLELNINFTDVSTDNVCRATVPFHQPSNQGSVSFPPSHNMNVDQHQHNRNRTHL